MTGILTEKNKRLAGPGASKTAADLKLFWPHTAAALKKSDPLGKPCLGAFASTKLFKQAEGRPGTVTDAIFFIGRKLGNR